MLKGLEKAGLKSLDVAFRQKQVHDSSLKMIKTAIKHPESIPDSREYGKTITANAFRDSLVREDLKRLSLQVVKHDQTKSASGQFIKTVLVDEKLKEATS